MTEIKDLAEYETQSKLVYDSFCNNNHDINAIDCGNAAIAVAEYEDRNDISPTTSARVYRQHIEHQQNPTFWDTLRNLLSSI